MGAERTARPGFWRGRGGAWLARGAAVLAPVLVLATALWWYPPLWQAAYAPVGGGAAYFEAGDGRLDVNTATAAELTALPGIGEKRAAAIVAYRQANGPFTSPEELLAVPGIGPKILEGLLPYVEQIDP